MRGLPKHFNSKQDYLNCLQDTELKAGAKADLQRLLDNRYVWVDTAILEASETGVTDSTHRVIDGEDVKIQQELQEDERAELFALGFTVQEVEDLIND